MKALEFVVAAVAIYAVIVIAEALWKQASAQNAIAQAQLMKQAGYTNLEMNAGNAILGSIFG
jgi:hypothetical protein